MANYHEGRLFEPDSGEATGLLTRTPCAGNSIFGTLGDQGFIRDSMRPKTRGRVERRSVAPHGASDSIRSRSSAPSRRSGSTVAITPTVSRAGCSHPKSADARQLSLAARKTRGKTDWLWATDFILMTGTRRATRFLRIPHENLEPYPGRSPAARCTVPPAQQGENADFAKGKTGWAGDGKAVFIDEGGLRDGEAEARLRRFAQS